MLKVLTYRIITEDEGDALDNINDIILDTLCFSLEDIIFISEPAREATPEEIEHYQSEMKEKYG